jgi:hypothetical protein
MQLVPLHTGDRTQLDPSPVCIRLHPGLAMGKQSAAAAAAAGGAVAVMTSGLARLGWR